MKNPKFILGESHAASEKIRLSIISPSITCKAGCSHCCKRKIEITMAEAFLLYSNLEDTGEWESIKKECLNLQKFTSLDPSVWFKSEISCPLLDRESNLCRVYSLRPVVCSSHFVTSNPDSCSPSSSSNSYSRIDTSSIKKEFLDNISSLKDDIQKMIFPLSFALLLAERIRKEVISE